MCYSGTHDNPPLAAWLEEALPEDVQLATDYLGLNPVEGMVSGLIRGCMGSVSDLCMIQMQDYLELGAGSRMNAPGFPEGNWLWRAEAGSFTRELAGYIRSLTLRYGRL